MCVIDSAFHPCTNLSIAKKHAHKAKAADHRCGIARYQLMFFTAY